MTTAAIFGPVPALQRLFAPVILTASQASVTFSPIPQGYSALRLVAALRGDYAGTNVETLLQFNGDGGANYVFETFYANGTGTASAGNLAQTGLYVGSASGSTAPAGSFALLDVTIPFYASTALQKGAVAACVQRTDATSSGIFDNRSAGFWLNTAAMTSVTILPSTGNFVAGSSVTLYGML